MEAYYCKYSKRDTVYVPNPDYNLQQSHTLGHTATDKTDQLILGTK